MKVTESFLHHALESLRQEIFSTMRVAMPGNIVSYDDGTGLAVIQPALRRKTRSGQILTAPQLSGVPVFRPTADHPISPGDPCLLLFMYFCMDGWLDTGQPVLPPSPRQHDLSDAVAITGSCRSRQS